MLYISQGETVVERKGEGGNPLDAIGYWGIGGK